MSDYHSLLADTGQLPLGERLRLIESLWNTLPEDAMPPHIDDWLAEIQRRTAEFNAGLTQPIPWEQIRAEALYRLYGAG